MWAPTSPFASALPSSGQLGARRCARRSRTSARSPRGMRPRSPPPPPPPPNHLPSLMAPTPNLLMRPPPLPPLPPRPPQRAPPARPANTLRSSRWRRSSRRRRWKTSSWCAVANPRHRATAPPRPSVLALARSPRYPPAPSLCARSAPSLSPHAPSALAPPPKALGRVRQVPPPAALPPRCMLLLVASASALGLSWVPLHQATARRAV